MCIPPSAFPKEGGVPNMVQYSYQWNDDFIQPYPDKLGRIKKEDYVITFRQCL